MPSKLFPSFANNKPKKHFRNKRLGKKGILKDRQNNPKMQKDKH